MTVKKFKILILIAVGFNMSSLTGQLRSTYLLNGVWEVEQGTMNTVPATFSHHVDVPALIDMAEPAFAGVGKVSSLRQAFWYRTTFHVDEELPKQALLKILKAKYGTRVYLNGEVIGEQFYSFTPLYFDLSEYLLANGQENELIVRVGANRESLPTHIADGWDFEKEVYVPGIYDDVELILTGSPYLVRIQATPKIEKNKLAVQITVKNLESVSINTTIDIEVFDSTNVLFSAAISPEVALAANGEKTISVDVDMGGCELWSPENPYLYRIHVSNEADSISTAVGMRSFSFDPETGLAKLNGKTHYMRGSNVTFFRFVEDPIRENKPWDKDWVRKVFREYKSMNWDMLRFSIGFPPEFWYDIADEEGFLIQDEFPIWYFAEINQRRDFTKEGLVSEFTDWMNERTNHPSVVIWDACNETSHAPVIAEAIAEVRGLDNSNRPWENSTNGPSQAGDPWEAHPYHFINESFRITDLADLDPFPSSPHNPPSYFKPPSIIINEYGWLWINRDGSPTLLSRNIWKTIVGADAQPDDYRKAYASHVATLTEFWRGYRQATGVLHFCGLGYSRTDGYTSDNFIDIVEPRLESYFKEYVGDAFAPLGLMIEKWPEGIAANAPAFDLFEIPVIVTNDYLSSFHGDVTLSLLCGDTLIYQKTDTLSVEGMGQGNAVFNKFLTLNEGEYKLVAELADPLSGDTISSFREFAVITPEKVAEKNGISTGKEITASSVEYNNSSLAPENANDGNMSSRWSSQLKDDELEGVDRHEWIQIDLGSERKVWGVSLTWEAAYGREYAIQTSFDGENWTNVYFTSFGTGGVEQIAFDTTQTRFVRMYGSKRGTPWGYSLYEFVVFGETTPLYFILNPDADIATESSAVIEWETNLNTSSNIYYKQSDQPDDYVIFGSSVMKKNHSVEIPGLIADAKYIFHIYSVSGEYTYLTDSIEYTHRPETLSLNQIASQSMHLQQNHPNPFCCITQIEIGSLYKCKASLHVFNVSGEKVLELPLNLAAGSTMSIDVNMSGFTDAIYYYFVSSDSGVSETKKMLLIR